jgi:hypothetical protein
LQQIVFTFVALPRPEIEMSHWPADHQIEIGCMAFPRWQQNVFTHQPGPPDLNAFPLAHHPMKCVTPCGRLPPLLILCNFAHPLSQLRAHAHPLETHSPCGLSPLTFKK